MHMELNNPQVCHSLTPKCSLVQTYPLNSWEIPMVIIHFMISHLGLKSNNLIMSFFLKKFRNHYIAIFLFSTNASFVVNKFGFVTCSRIWYPLSSPPCILGSIGNHYVLCIISQCKSYAKVSIKLPILPTTWAPTFKRIATIVNPTITKWTILGLLLFFTNLISSCLWSSTNMNAIDMFTQ